MNSYLKILLVAFVGVVSISLLVYAIYCACGNTTSKYLFIDSSSTSIWWIIATVALSVVVLVLLMVMFIPKLFKIYSNSRKYDKIMMGGGGATTTTAKHVTANRGVVADLFSTPPPNFGGAAAACKVPMGFPATHQTGVAVPYGIYTPVKPY